MRSRIKHRFNEYERFKVEELHFEGYSASEIHTQLNIDFDRIKDYLVEKGLYRDPSISNKKKRDAIINDYKNGVTLEELEHYYVVDKYALHRILGAAKLIGK